MNNQEKNIITDQLLINFIKKETTKKESLLIESWLEDKQNKEHFDGITKLWQHSEYIHDFEAIDTNKDWETVRSRIWNNEHKLKIRKINTLSLILKVAAVIIVLAGITILIRNYLMVPPEMIAISTNSHQSEVILPDESKVYLNKYSTLTFPEKFSRKDRNVILSGEAYFEITPEENRSFRIQTLNGATIEVLGTTFNVNTDSVSSEVMVHVTSGKVSIYQTGSPENKAILTKNEKATLKNNKISKSNFDDPNFLSWKTGILEFKNKPLEYVVIEISDFYKQPIVLIDRSTKELIYTTTIDNQPLEEVLEEIKLVFDLEYATKNDTIFIIPNQ